MMPLNWRGQILGFIGCLYWLESGMHRNDICAVDALSSGRRKLDPLGGHMEGEMLRGILTWSINHRLHAFIRMNTR